LKSVVRKAVARAGGSNPGGKSKTKKMKTKKKTKTSRRKAKAVGKGIGHSEKELEGILKSSQAVIRVVGTGGSGNNTMQRLSEIGIKGADTIAMNTDAQHLINTTADHKLLLGRDITRGLGAGSNPELGEAAAKESVDEIEDILAGSDMVFVTCGLGGGTGTGSAHVLSQVGKDAGALTIAIVTLPFSVEGRRRMENAMDGLKKLRKEADTVIVIPNDKLLEIVPDLPINAAFKVADEILANAVKGITEMITRPGLVQLDLADVRTILSNGGAAMIGLGDSDTEGDSESRALEAVEEALNSPLLDIDISESTRALINVNGGADMTLREAELIVEAVSSKIHSNAHIIWGAMIDNDMPRNAIQAMVVVSGGRFPYLDELESGKSGETSELEIDVEYLE
jgi:cell division protein FtsZ